MDQITGYALSLPNRLSQRKNSLCKTSAKYLQYFLHLFELFSNLYVLHSVIDTADFTCDDEPDKDDLRLYRSNSDDILSSFQTFAGGTQYDVSTR